MNDDVKRDLSRSTDALTNIVWPIISTWIGGGELVVLESATDQGLARDLDMLAGIDALQIRRSQNTIRGIGSRVQWLGEDEPLWNSFTVRYLRTSGADTEYKKRVAAVCNTRAGILYPTFTVQAYLRENTNEVLSVGCIRTHDLFNYINNGEEGKDYKIRTNKADGNLFIAVYWSHLTTAGIAMRSYIPQGNPATCNITTSGIAINNTAYLVCSP